VLGLISTRWAGNFGVASREFRIIVLDPILLYALVRLSASSISQTRLLVNGLLASGVAVSAIGLYQYVTGDVILADGIARLTAVWGSPNNVGLYLGRLLPIALACAFLLRDDGGRRTNDERPRINDERQLKPDASHSTLHAERFSFDHASSMLGPSSVLRRYDRWLYGGIAALFALTILLTYSRGALFFGVPASIGFVLIVLYLQSHHLSRRAWLGIGLALILGALALIPFVLSERFQSLFQTGTGTGFFRVAVWSSAVNMIRDHPLLGVGLDNFLYEYPKYILPEAWREPNLSHPHNILLDFWVRLGLGGVLVGVWMLVAFFRRAWKSFTTVPEVYVRALMLGLMGSVVDMLAHGLIDASFFVIDLAYVFLLTLAFAQIPSCRDVTR
jgi:O-antigen ligase